MLKSVRISSVSRYDQPFEPHEPLDAVHDTILLFDFGRVSLEPSGVEIRDLSGNGNHGTLHNGWGSAG